MSESVVTASLGQNIRVLSGFAFPSAGFNQLEGMPLIRIRDLANADTEVKFRGQYDPAYLIKKGDVLIGMDGDFEVHRWNGDDALLNQRVCKVEAATRQIDQAFLYWYLKPRVADIHRRTPQTTVRHLSASDLYTIPAAPIGAAEQSVVAQILDTLDTAIHETEAIIAKLKAVKQGLLHDLLTRGVDAKGELRPPPAEAPHLYKQSPLGWIPKEWDSGTIVNYLDAEQGIKPGPFGSSIKKDSYSEAGYKVYGQEQVIGGNQEIGNYFVPLRKFQELRDFAVQVGDVLISLVGTIGKVLVLEDPLAPGLINPRLMRLRPDTRRAYPEFVGFLIASDLFVKHVIANAGGGTMPVINKRIIAGIRVPVVPPDEQAEILTRRSAVDQRISWEATELEKLRAEKAGLMDDLLTGRIRVTPLLAKAERQVVNA